MRELKINLLRITLIVSTLAFISGCADLAIFLAAGNSSFSIKNETKLVFSADPEFQWTKPEQVQSYDLLIAKDALCRETVTENPGLKEERFVLQSLPDGNYFFCIYAHVKQARIPATNNGAAFTIDRENPVVSIPSEIPTYGQAFSPEMKVEDLTATSITWTLVSGPGILAFHRDPEGHETISVDKDGLYQIKATIIDQANHTVEQMLPFRWNGEDESSKLRFISLVGSGVASDSFVNISEKNSSEELWILSAKNATSVSYTKPVENSGSNLVCDSTQAYDSPTIARGADIVADGTYAICVKLTSASGQSLFGKSEDITRDTTAPVFTSMILANAALDGFINDAEKILPPPLWSLTANGYSSARYTAALSDAVAVVCDESQTYSESSVPPPFSLTADGPYTLCVQLSDAAGNTSHGKAVSVVRDITPSSATSISINGAATMTTSTNVTLTLGASDTHSQQMFITNDPGCTTGGAWENFASTKSWTLAQVDTTASVYVKFRDAALNVSACLSDSIVHSVPPSATSVAIEANAPSVSALNVTLDLGATGATEVYVTNRAGCTSGGVWSTYAAQKGWIISLDASGTATVYVKYRSIGLSESPCISDTVSFIAPNRIVNGDFESAFAAPWTQTIADKWIFDTNNVNTGSFSAHTQSLDDSTRACLSQSVNLSTQPGTSTLTFNLKYGTEANFDFFEFWIDSTKVINVSGLEDWAPQTVQVPGGGVRSLKWCYSKDGSITDNGDTVWIDEVKLLGGALLPPASIATFPLHERIELTINAAPASSYSRFMIVRGTSPVAFVPVNGVAYSVGAQGNDHVVSNGSGSTFMDVGLVEGQTYYYSVFAASYANHYSMPVTANAASEALHRPRTLVSSPIGTTDLTLDWTVDGGGEETGFMLVRNASAAPTFVPVNGTSYAAGLVTGGTIAYQGSDLTYLDTGLTAGTRYYYEIWAMGAGNSYSSVGTSASGLPCDGYAKHGTCWYMSAKSQSCNNRCAAVHNLSFDAAANLATLGDGQGYNCQYLIGEMGNPQDYWVSAFSSANLFCGYSGNSGTSRQAYVSNDAGRVNSGTFSHASVELACPCR